MPFLVGCLGLFFPRIAIILVWLFSTYLQDAYQTVIWPVLGFFFLPLTTLAYAFASHQGSGSISGIGTAIIVVAVLLDLGMMGGGARSTQQFRAANAQR